MVQIPDSSLGRNTYLYKIAERSDFILKALRLFLYGERSFAFSCRMDFDTGMVCYKISDLSSLTFYKTGQP
jgi:hypothetical protein